MNEILQILQIHNFYQIGETKFKKKIKKQENKIFSKKFIIHLILFLLFLIHVPSKTKKNKKKESNSGDYNFKLYFNTHLDINLSFVAF